MKLLLLVNFVFLAHATDAYVVDASAQLQHFDRFQTDIEPLEHLLDVDVDVVSATEEYKDTSKNVQISLTVAEAEEKYQQIAKGYSKFKELFFPQMTEWKKLQLKLKDAANKYIQAYDQLQSLNKKFVLSRLPSDRAAFGTAATLLVSQGNAYDAIALEEETMQNQIRNQIEAFRDTFLPFEKLNSDMWKIVEGWPQPTYSI